MSNKSNGMRQRPRMTRMLSTFQNYVQRLFSFKGRAIFRQNAIRQAIASLIETERMRLATTIGHRDHN